jgi:hypothetical protein
MITTTIKKTKNAALSLALAVGMAVTAITPPAAAADVTGTVSIVEFSHPGSLLIQSAGVNYYAQLSPGAPCAANNKTADTLKAWQSLGQAALLSGKTVRIYYASCNGFRFITALDLNA